MAPLRSHATAGLALVAAAFAATGCKKSVGAADAAVAGADAGEEVVALAVSDAGAADAGVTLHALGFVTPVMNEPEVAPRDPSKASDERKGVVRLGYLRKGDTVAVKPALLKKSSCLEGWYELVTGGFVCGKYATLDATDKELESAPRPPNMQGPLPYDYGLNLVNGAPIYRRLPLRRERREHERGLAVGRAPPPESAEPSSGDTPWYLAHKDKSKISMDDLKGESALIDERMVRGFYLALDEEVHSHAGHFWRSQRGMFVPKEFILVHEPKVELEGVWLDAPRATDSEGGSAGVLPARRPTDSEGGSAGVLPARRPIHLPLGWITNPHQWKYTLADDGKMRRHEHVDRFAVVELTGKKQVVEEKAYWETTEGWWMREMDGTLTGPAPPPKDLASGERWIDVNLGRQSLVAFEGERPVFATIVSTGRHDDEDSDSDHRTRPGAFRIFEKHIAATMDADTATDGPYSIEDVPWIMYFDGSTALHGAFWHSRFGHERSHGCVNLTPHDAHELFAWVGPRLPDGWHGVHATEANPGTRVLVHDDGKTAEASREDWTKRKGEAAGDAGASAR
jgi:hypothetical protein